MTQQRVDGEAAYVVDVRSYRETSVLAKLLTLNHGIVSVVAKGVRGSNRGNAGLLQPCIPLLVSWQGTRELKTLLSVDPATPYRFAPTLPGEYRYALLYINELLARLLRDSVDPGMIFAHYCVFLEQIKQQLPLEPSLRTFERQLLEYLGVAYDMSQDYETGEPIQQQQHYALVDGEGFHKVSAGTNQTPETSLIPGDVLLQIAAGDFTREAANFSKFIHRHLIGQLLGGKPLKSRELFIKMKELKNG